MSNEISWWTIISSLGTILGATGTFLAIFSLFFKKNLGNFFNPINLELQIVDDCETNIDIYDHKISHPLDGIEFIKLERYSTYYFLKIINKKRSRAVKNVGVKFTGYKLLHINSDFNQEVPKYLIHTPINQNKTRNDINDYLFIGFLRCYHYNNSIYVDLCTDENKSIYNSINDNGIISVRLEVEADGLIYDIKYEIEIHWNRNSIECYDTKSFNFVIKKLTKDFIRTTHLYNKFQQSLEKLS